MKRMLLVEIFLLVTVMLAGPSRAAVFSCDDAGLDAAVAASKAGDAGPHSLDCSPGDIILLDRARRDPSQRLTADLTLDGRGATIECSSFRCDPVFIVDRQFPCELPICISPVVELRNLTLLGAGVELRDFPIPPGAGVWIGDVELTLRNTVVTGSGDAVRVLGGTLHLVDSTVTENITSVEVLGGSATIESSLLATTTGFFGGGPEAGLLIGFGAAAQLINSTVAGITNGGRGCPAPC